VASSSASAAAAEVPRRSDWTVGPQSATPTMDILRYARRGIGVVDAKLIDSRGRSVPRRPRPAEGRKASDPLPPAAKSHTVAVTNCTAGLSGVFDAQCSSTLHRQLSPTLLLLHYVRRPKKTSAAFERFLPFRTNRRGPSTAYNYGQCSTSPKCHCAAN